MTEQPRNVETSAPAGPLETRRRFECHVNAAGGLASAWVHVVGGLDLVHASEVASAVRRAGRHALLVVLDLREVTSIDAAGLSAMVDGWQRARQLERRIVLIVNAGSHVHGLLELTGLDRHLDVINDPAVAVPAESRSEGAGRPDPAGSHAPARHRHVQ